MTTYADCERRDGWLDQDVNAWTSLGYVAAGVGIAMAGLAAVGAGGSSCAGRRSRRGDRPDP